MRPFCGQRLLQKCFLLRKLFPNLSKHTFSQQTADILLKPCDEDEDVDGENNGERFVFFCSHTNEYDTAIFVNNHIFWVRETEEEKVIFFKIFWHILLLLMIKELLDPVTSQKVLLICCFTSALIEISALVLLSFKVFTLNLRIKA